MAQRAGGLIVSETAAPRLTASDRVRRVLSMVPWIAANDGPTIDEVCRRFDISRKRLVADLEIVPFVGVAPFTADVLIESIVDDERVWVRYTPVFERPLRITPPQALALVATGQTLLSAPGADEDGPLARGLAKLATTLDIDPADAVDIQIERVSETIHETLRDAVDRYHQVEIDYYSYNRDDRSRRVIEPHRLMVDGGNHYVEAYCHQAEDERVFRLDRIRDLTVLETTFDPPAVDGPGRIFEPGPDDPRAVIDLGRDALWVVEQYPVEAIAERPDGERRVTLVISARQWFERLLLRLGSAATVVEADERVGGPTVGADAARRILSRYGA